MRHLLCGAVTALALPVLAGAAYAQGCSPAPVGQREYDQTLPLTLERAVARAGHAAPEILIAALEARAASADADQAGRWLNPAISVDTENFAGTGGLEGFDAYETTLALEQTFRLGGKRRLSERAARAEAALASAECNVQRLEAQRLAGELFLDLQAAIEMADVADASASLAEEFANVVERRVEAGAAAPPELLRAKAEAASLQAAADAARGNVEAAAISLASIWGSPDVDYVLPRPENFDVATDSTGSDGVRVTHPRLQAAQASADARAAATDRARAGAWPDVTVSAGVRRFEDTGDSAFLAGISLPLPVFDRNQDATRAARFRTEGAELNARAVEARLRAEQASLAAQVRAAKSRLQRLEGEALPLAEGAYASAAEGYRVGKFDLTATLDARRSLIETRAAVIEARLALQTQTLRLRALIGAAPFEGEIQ
ncbi:TolC family protein [Henriciella aquimarina]|uniref:TolC family protein n=1 Tax=Henriciella aquimarina TaxID=545261 RepID=UPI000A06CEC4|nr:TolC family protein [Henriciella aquimarina]